MRRPKHRPDCQRAVLRDYVKRWVHALVLERECVYVVDVVGYCEGCREGSSSDRESELLPFCPFCGVPQ